MDKERPVDLSLGDLILLGSRIRLRRYFVGKRLSPLAREVDIDPGYLSHIENNSPLTRPSGQLVTNLAQKLDIAVELLRESPLICLTNGLPPEQFVTFPLALKYRESHRPRTGVERIQRILALGHLTEPEEAAVVKEIVKHAGQLVKLARTLRQQ